MKLLHVTGVVASCALAATSAQAAIVYVTYSGTIATGSDLTGVFGAPNANLAGLTYTATYLFDDAIGTVSYNPPTSSTFNSGFFNSNPKVALTINNQTFVSNCGFFAADSCNLSLFQSAAPGDWRIDAQHSAFTVDTAAPGGPETWSHTINNGVSSATNAFVASFDYHTPLNYTLQPGDASQGVVSLVNRENIGSPDERYGYFVQAQLTPLTVSVAVPEPASWSLMILGFGMAGAALRRRTAPRKSRLA